MSRRNFLGFAALVSASGVFLSELHPTKAAATTGFNPAGAINFYAWDTSYLKYTDWYADGQPVFVSDASYPGGGYYRVEAATAPENGAYTVTYDAVVPESGLYDLRWSSTPPDQSWASPFALSVNGGAYGNVGGAGRFGQINSTVQCYDQGSIALYNASVVAQDVSGSAPNVVQLHNGLNTISFRVTTPRALDGKYVMYLNSIALTPVDRQPGSISHGSPLGVYTSGSTQFTVNMTAAIVAATTMTVTLSDYWHSTVYTNTYSVPVGAQHIQISPPTLPVGYYQVDVSLAGGAQQIRGQLAVVGAPVTTDLPFGTDAALSELVPAANVADFVTALKNAGVGRVRERIAWDAINTSSGTYDWSSITPTLNAYANSAVKSSPVFAKAPAWALSGSDLFPADLRNIYTFAKAAGNQFPTQAQSWEVWNEPDFGGQVSPHEPADAFAAVVKAAAIGFADSSSNAVVCSGGMSFGAGTFAQEALSNDLLSYVDAYAYHGYSYAYYPGGPANYPFPTTQTQGQVNLVRSASNSVGLWMTEAGLPIPRTELTSTLDAGQFGPSGSSVQRSAQARYIVTSAVQSLAAGTDHHFWFVLPFYSEYSQVYGLFSIDQQPYSAYSALAALTRALGDVAYVGIEPNMPSGVSAYWFDDGTNSILVTWATSTTSVTFTVGSGASTITNIMGQSSTQTTSGSMTLSVGPDPQYVRTGRIHTASPNPGAVIPSAPKARSLQAGRRIVLQPVFSMAAAFYSRVYGAYQLSTTSPNTVTLNVYNFSSASQTTTLSSAGSGWTVSFSSSSVTVPAGGMVPVTVALTTNGPTAKPQALTFTATTGGVASTAQVRVQPAMQSLTSNVVANSGSASSWNAAGTGCTVTNGSTTGDVNFAFAFGPDGGGGYPAIAIANPSILTGATGFVFQLYCPSTLPDTTKLSILAKQSNGATYFTATGYPLNAGWNQIIAPFDQFVFAEFGGPDASFQFAPTTVTTLQIGINSPLNIVPTYTIRGLGTYALP